MLKAKLAFRDWFWRDHMTGDVLLKGIRRAQLDVVRMLATQIIVGGHVGRQMI